ncbi:pdz/dhr/glgf [Cordyceps fumosorosea ARSEF 2679]|uniref:Pdz/dhr/glgf n=1 Tax=Cordyceps fumosorosea (strain ARSEF 2679) TaxID=1081104 RepID=A0A168B0M6_CORFA|nr:pdz/dhr/glgf [Cordyceps fumosorosea ARSEF 2679]OAA69450.1 pdz/dhr/glgf [Cordyceps fumosorosea ARSEF 2679]
MLKKSYPALSLRIRPIFTPRGDVSHLSVSFTVPKSALTGSNPHLNYTTWFGNFAAHPYTESDIYATDTVGRLPFIFVDETSTLQQWRLGRDPVSDLTIKMDVFPRKVDIHTAPGPRVDLRFDQGGLVGTGAWFLPEVAQGSFYTHSVEWDLSTAPPGTRAVWTYGEGPRRVEQHGTVDTFARSVFMVGPIQSSPPGPRLRSSPGTCTTYWFGNLPPILQRVKGFNTELYTPMADFFQDLSGSYRVFIRTAPRGWGGSSFLSSYILEYSNSILDVADEEVTGLLAHEMVHSFTALSNEENGDENAWYIEGIADYYATFLPYRFGLVPPSYVTTRVNASLYRYYANPEINISMDDALKYFFTSWYSEWIPYDRGFAYLLLVDDQLRRLPGQPDSNSSGLFDRIVLDISARWRRGEKVQQKDWLASIEYFLQGRVDCAAQLQAVLAGRPSINLAGRRVGSTRNVLRETRQPVIQFGYSRLSASRRIVEGVVSGSHAERAGLRNGDVIISTGSTTEAAQDPLAKYYVVVNRDGEEIRIEYSPPSKIYILQYFLIHDRGGAGTSLAMDMLPFRVSSSHPDARAALTAFASPRSDAALLTSLPLVEPGTNRWILDDEHVAAWLAGGDGRPDSDSDARSWVAPGLASTVPTIDKLWLYGPSGSGRTLLAATMVRHLARRLPDEPRQAVGYYFASDSPAENETVACLRALVAQLAQQSEAAHDEFRNSVRLGALPSVPHEPVDGVVARLFNAEGPADLGHLLEAMSRHFAKVFLVVRGVDYMEAALALQLAAMADAPGSTIKTAFTSSDGGGQQQACMETVSCPVEVAAAQDELSLYVRNEMERRIQQGDTFLEPESPRKEIEEYILRNNHGS